MSRQTEMAVSQPDRGHMLVSNGGQRLSVPIGEVSYFEVIKHSVKVYYGQGEVFEFFSTLGSVEEELEGLGFVRVHRSFLVRVGAIERYDAHSLVLRGGKLLPVGRTFRPRLEREMERIAVVTLRSSQER